MQSRGDMELTLVSNTCCAPSSKLLRAQQRTMVEGRLAGQLSTQSSRVGGGEFGNECVLGDIVGFLTNLLRRGRIFDP